MRRDTDTYGNPSGGAPESSAALTRPSGPASWLRELFKAAEARRLTLGALSWPLRLAVALTISGSILAAFFLLTQNVPQPHISTFAGKGLPDSRLPAATFLCALLLWIIAWAFALTGALHGHWTLRLLVLAAFLYPMIQTYFADIHVLIYLAPIIILYVWGVIVSLAQWRAAHAKRATQRWLPAVTFAVVSMTLIAYYVSLYVFLRAAPSTSTADFAQLLTLQIQALAIILLPMLFLSGSDMAEWGAGVSEQVGVFLRRLRPSWPLITASVLFAAGVLFIRLKQRGDFTPFELVSVYDIVELLLVSAIVAGLALLIARLGRLSTWTAHSIPPWAFVVASVVTMAGLAGPQVASDVYLSTHSPAVSAVSQYIIYQHTAGNLPFSVAYPAGWQVFDSEPTATLDLTAVDFVSQVNQHTYEFTVLVAPPAEREASDLLSATEVVQGLCNCTPSLTAAPPHGQWQALKTSGTQQFTNGSAPVPQDGFVWWQAHGPNLWVIYAHTNPSDTATYSPIFTAMLDSWRFDPRAVAPTVQAPLPAFVSAISSWDPTGALSLGLIPLLLGLLIGLPLLVKGRATPGPTNVAGLFLLIFGLKQGLTFYPRLLALAGVPAPRIPIWTPPGAHPLVLTALPTLSFPMLQVVVAIITVVALAGMAIRRRRSTRGVQVLRALFSINLALLAIALIEMAFERSDQASSRISVTQAVLIVAALIWDLATSGERMATSGEHGSRRSARLLLYLGYSIASFTLVMYMATLSASGSPFDLGNWTALGISALGVPLLGTLFLMHINRPDALPSEKLMVSEPDARPPEHADPIPAPAQTSLAPRPALPSDIWPS